MKLILFILTLSYFSYSQGCSDAGICSLPEHDNENKRNYVIGFEQGWGMAKQSVKIFNSNIEFYVDLNEKFTFSGFVPFLNTINEIETSSGIGDPILVLSYRNKAFDNFIQLDIGSRLPLGNDNNSIASGGLPMYWQQGLGTFDLIFRASYILEKWDFLLGAQIPLTEQNDNSFDNIERNDFSEFEPSAMLSRAADIIGRIRYKIYSNNKFHFSIGALGIYAIHESSYLSDIQSTRIKLEHSDGLVLNLITGADYELNEKIKLTMEFGAPIIERESEPSGLDRALQLNFGIFYNLVK